MEESRSGFDSSSSSSGESVKLFVGQVPKNMNEDELLSIFKEIALIDEINIIKDKLTRTSRGCCFLICPSRQEADKAVNAFHNKKTLPGASTPLQVKYADGELERLEHKLFVGMLPKNVTDVEVSTLFSKYGNIKELQILRGSQQTSKGCAFLKYETKEQAVSALDAINGKYKMEGSSVPLVVKWADTEKERQARKAQKAMASGVSSTNPAQQPSLFGALPMNHLPLYNGFGYQAPGSYGLMQYPHGIRGLSPDLAARISPRNFPPVPSSNYIRPRFPAIPGLRYPISSAGVQAEGPPGANLFIYHIPQEFGDQELANAFKQFGTVLSAKVFVDKATGVSKCFGFVSYDSPTSAQSAISEMNGYQLGGKKLKVQIKRENKTSKPF